MKSCGVSPNALLYWMLRLTAIALLPFLLSVWGFGRTGLLWTVFTLSWVGVYLFFAFFWYPVKYRKVRVELDQGALCVRSGIFYTRWKYMDFSSVQYISVLGLPLQRAMGMLTVVVYGSGCFLLIPCLAREDACRLRDTVTPAARRMEF